MIIASFVIFLLVVVVIGVASTLKSDRSNADYLLAGRNVSPWLVGLSAMATNNSGYLFIGAIWLHIYQWTRVDLGDVRLDGW